MSESLALAGALVRKVPLTFPQGPSRAMARVGGPVVLMAWAVACAPHVLPGPQTLAGTYRGETADGTELVLRFSQEGEAFHGAGTLGGEPVVVAGAVGWRGAGSLAAADGRSELVGLELSGSGESLTLERPGGERSVLYLVEAPAVPTAGGPFAGTWRATRDRAALAEVTLVESDGLLAGVGTVTGDAVGVSGRVTDPGRAEGMVTFRDGTQVRFAAVLDAGEKLTVTGFGRPIVLSRRSP